MGVYPPSWKLNRATVTAKSLCPILRASSATKRSISEASAPSAGLEFEYFHR